jgi:hypothetical protein
MIVSVYIIPIEEQERFLNPIFILFFPFIFAFADLTNVCLLSISVARSSTTFRPKEKS